MIITPQMRYERQVEKAKTKDRMLEQILKRDFVFPAPKKKDLVEIEPGNFVSKETLGLIEMSKNKKNDPNLIENIKKVQDRYILQKGKDKISGLDKLKLVWKDLNEEIEKKIKDAPEAVRKSKKEASNIITNTNGYKYYSKLFTVAKALGIGESTLKWYRRDYDLFKYGIKKYRNENGTIAPGYNIHKKTFPTLKAFKPKTI